MSKTILIIEDSSFQRHRITRALAEGDFSIVEATNGKEGLEMITSVRPDLIILDLLMPEMDGIDVLTELQRQNNSIPVIVLTADIQVTVQETCRNLGARAILMKPVQPIKLNHAVMQAMDADSL